MKETTVKTRDRILTATFILFSISIFTIPRALSALSLPIALTEETGRFPVARQNLEIYEDTTGKLDIEDVSSPEISQQFEPSKEKTPNFGYTSSSYWFRFSVRNEAAEDTEWLLEIQYPLLDYIDLYIPAQSSYSVKRSGDRLRFDKREIKHRNFIFTLPCRKDEVTTFYLRVRSDSTMAIPLVIWSSTAFIEKDQSEQYLLGLYYGIIIVMILYNLFIFFSLKDQDYLYYVLYLIAFGIFQSTMNGLAFEYLWPENSSWGNRAVPFFVSIALLLLLVFSKSFLQVKHSFPKINRIFLVLIGFDVVFCVLALFCRYSLTVRTNTMLAFISVSYIFLCSVFCFLKGYQPARFMIFAWTAFLGGLLISILRGFGVLPNNFFTLYGMQIGSALEVVLFSLALADRFNLIRKEKENAQAEVIKNKNEVVQALNKTNQLKNDFLSMTAHELRTPLHGIIGISESLISSKTENISDFCRKNLNMIVLSGKRLSSLVNNLLDLSRLRYDDIHLNLQPVNLQTVVDIVLELSKPLAQSKNISLESDIPHNLPLIEADENRLQQILHNLIDNAVKYTESGSVNLTAERQDELVTVSIRDTGIGIDQKRFEEIFKPFEQLNPSNDEPVSGIGVGLSITQKLIDKHGGKIWLESEMGVGSCFYFTLRISQTQTEQIDKPLETDIIPGIEQSSAPGDFNTISQNTGGKNEEHDIEKHRLLIVEDDPINMQVLDNYLTESGFTLCKAYNAEEAQEFLDRGEPPDLILLDIMMPGISGLEFCKKIRQSLPMHELPIIFLTARNQLTDILEGFSLGANDYLVKPFGKEELTTRIINQLRLADTNCELASLRNLAVAIQKTKNTQLIMMEFLKTLFENLECQQAVLFQNNRILKKLSRNQDSMLNSLPPPELLAETTNIVTSLDIKVYNALGKDHPLVKHYRAKSNLNLEGNHIVYIKPEPYPHETFILIRNRGASVFSNLDIEFIRSCLQILMSQKNDDDERLFDAELISTIHEINTFLDNIVYVKSESEYRRFFVDKEINNPLLHDAQNGLWIKDYLISMNDIQNYFSEVNLLRIHRSCFINPKKIINIKRKKPTSPDFLAYLQTDSGYVVTAAIGRSYLPIIKESCARFFQKQ